MAKKRTNFRKYSPEFKISYIIDRLTNNLSYKEECKKYLCEKCKESCYMTRIKLWKHIYLEEREAEFYIKRRGKTRKMDIF